MNIRVLPILLVCYLLLPDISLGQNCSCIDCPGVANVFSTTSYEYVLEDAINNDLSSPGQGICQIIVQFAPEHIWSLEMSVTSPGGQTINIIGPSSNQFGFTGPLPWEISFIPCGDAADPDSGFSDTWNNNQNWLAGDFYNGSYYPFSGCLEDFNAGPVNGSWTLSVTNNSPVNTASIVNFTVIPCDPSGIPCFDCEAVESQLVESLPQDLCQGDDNLMFKLQPQWSEIPDSSLYSYAFLISRDDVIIQVDSVTDLTNLVHGQYEICGLSYQTTDSLRLPDPADQITITELRDELAGIYNIFCAELSDNCLTINIIGHDTTNLQELRCIGDSYNFIDTTILTSGVYYGTLVSSILCDSIIKLDIDFSPSRDTLIVDSICQGSSYLFAGNLISDEGTYFHDTLTTIGCDSLIELRLSFINRPTTVIDTVLCFGDEIDVGANTYNSSGNFNVIVDSNDPCDSLVILNLVVLNPVPVIENSIFLNCDNNPLQLSAANSIGMNLSFQWEDIDNGGLGFDSDPDQALVDIVLEGSYNLIIIDSLNGVGCSQMASTSVIADFDLPQVTVVTPTLNCTNTFGQISLLPLSNITDYRWEGPNGFNSSLPNPIVTEAGSYELFITGSNGCLDSLNYNVAADTILPSFQLTPIDTITCNQPTVEINVGANGAYDISGTAPGSIPFFGNNFSTSVAGQYILYVQNVANGCIADTTFFISENIAVPTYTFNQPIISCENPSGELSIEALGQYDYEWSNTTGFLSSDSIIIANNAGPFFVAIIGENGCAALDTFDITLDTIAPDISINGGMFTCLDSVINLEGLSNTPGVNFSWFNTAGFISNSQTIQVDQVDQFTLVVEATNGCQSELNFTPITDSLLPSIVLPVIELDCNLQSQNIIPTFVSSYQTIEWEGPNGFLSNNPEPLVSTPGIYTVELISANGCQINQSFEVFEDVTEPDLILSTDSLNCFSTIGEISAQSNAATGINWNGPGGFSSTNFTISVSQAGLYTAQVIGANGCLNDSTIVVIADFDPPQVDLANDVITCIDTLAIVGDSTLNSNWEFLWTGPNSFISNLPFQEVSTPGNYQVVVQGENGCQAIENVIIDIDTNSIQIELSTDTLDCLHATATLEPIFSELPQFVQWTLPDNTNSNTINLITSESGNYELLVEASNGCVSTDITQVIFDTIHPTLIIDSISLSCADDSPLASINYTAVSPIFSWTGPNGFSSNIPTPEIIDSGMYILTIQDSNGCEIAQSMNVSNDIDLPIFSVEDDSLNCVDTSIVLQTSYSGNYSFEWTGPNGYLNANAQPSVNTEGIYQLLVLNNNNGCEDSINVNVFIDTIVPQSTLDNFELSCAVNQIQMQPDVVNAAWQYNWTGPTGFSSQLPNPFTGISGSYFLDIIGENGCVLSLENEVTANDSVPQLNFLLDTISCTDPIADIQVLSDLVGTVYSWTGPNGFVSAADILQLNEGGLYEVEGTAGNGCQVLSSLEILVDTLVPQFQINDTLISCENPSVTLAPISGQNNIYTWYDEIGVPLIAENFDVSFPGMYSVEAQATNGCISEVEYSVIGDFNLPSIVTTNEIINCQTDSVSLLGNTNNLLDSIYWTGPNNYFSEEIIPMVSEAGEYWLTAIGPNGCIDSLNLSVEIDTVAPQATLLADTITCQDSLATIVAMISNPNWLLNWSGPNTFSSDSAIIESTIPGVYNLEITGENFCSNNYSAEILVDQSVPNVSVPDSIIDCNNPSITLVPSVSTLVDQYSWSDGVTEISNDSDIVLTVAGNYLLNVVADNGCEANTSFEIIGNFIQPDFTISPDTINCQETSINFDLASNNFFGVSWQGPSGFSSNLLNPNTNLPGEYMFEITGANGCDTSGMIEIFADTLSPNISLSADVIDCSVDSVLVNISGDFNQVIWTIDSDQIVDGPVIWLEQASMVEGYFMGENFCSSTVEIEISEDLSIPMFQLESDTITCEQLNSNLEIVPIDPVSEVLWTGPNAFTDNQLIVSTNEPGLYYASISGLNSCVAVDSILVVEDIDLPILHVQGDTLDCFGNDFSVSSSLDPAIDSYSWTGPNSFFANEPLTTIVDAGVYNLEVIGLNGCDQTYSVEVLPATIPEIPSIIGNNILNCDSTSSQLSAIFSSPAFDFETNWIFENDSVSQSQNLTIDQEGIYYFEITNVENQCVSVDSIVVYLDTLTPDLQVAAISGLTITCANSSLLFEAFPSGNISDFTFEWLNNGNQISTLNNIEIDQPGTYLIELTSNANGCTTIDSVEVDLSNDIPEIEIQGPTILNCYDPIIDLEAFHDPLDNFTLNWEWNNQVIPGTSNNEQISINTSGLYQLEIINQETGCSNFDTILVAQNFDEPTLNFEQSNLIDCFNESAELSFITTLNEEVDYSWINNADTISSNSSIEINGEEDLILTGILVASGCPKTLAVNLNVGNLGPEELLLSALQPICPDDLGTINIDSVTGGVGPYLYSFQNNTFDNIENFGDLSPGEYLLVVQDADGCEQSSSLAITAATPVDLELGEDQTIGLGDSLILTPQSFSNITNYNWADSSLCINCSNPFVSPIQTTEYFLEVIDDRGCAALDRVTIFVKEKPIGFIPNVFSPNNDGSNDLFIPFFSSAVEEVLIFSIYSRWGEQVFAVENSAPDNSNLHWDGTLNGQILDPGVFVFRTEVLLKNGKKRAMSGDLTLIK